MRDNGDPREVLQPTHEIFPARGRAPWLSMGPQQSLQSTFIRALLTEVARRRQDCRLSYVAAMVP